LIGTFFVLWLFQNLIVISQQYALIVIGALLLVTMLFMPGGYVVWLAKRLGLLLAARKGKLPRDRLRDQPAGRGAGQ
jgi:branched-chain amino acid transport system permease protein